MTRQDQPDSWANLGRRWLRAKVKESFGGLGDPVRGYSARQDAYREEQQAEWQAQQRFNEEMGRALMPGLARRRDERAAAEEHRRHDEIAALPRATVQLSTTGVVAGSWAGELPVRWEAEVGADLTVELVVPDEEAAPDVGGAPLLGARLLVPGYSGPGHYDLAAIAGAADGEFDGTDWECALGSWEEAYYWVPGDYAGTIDVAPGTLAARLDMAGAGGDISLDLRLGNLPG